ncbi:TauD/TfdA family dioxygenase [Plantactinospora sp. CA-290183]|uniref:TauD/TfdA family dioxygenase n=1 Tax=Plantactinospora sp. CA-290183 TaxID=3240006 RepID=UPI003D92FC52
MSDPAGAVEGDFTITPLPATTIPGAPAPLLLSGGDRVPSSEQAAALRALLDRHGVLLIRGRSPAGPAEVARFAETLFPLDPVFETGEHPQADQAEAVYRPVPFDSRQTLMWHHENSFNAVFPRVLMFVCRTPAVTGGATTLVDSRLVYQRADAAATSRLHTTGIRYVRLCDENTGRRWQQLYGTDDSAQAARAAAAAGEELEIHRSTARIVATRPAFRTGAHGTVWFNQLLHWHPAALPDDLRRLVRRGAVPAFRDCTHGDGTPIGDDLIEHITAISQDVEYPVPWQAGDVLLVNNLVYAHGRHPYRGTREHFVRMLGHARHQHPDAGQRRAEQEG